MKKTFIALGIILIFLAVPATALEMGINMDAGIRQSLVNTYIYENFTFRAEFNDTFGMEAGVDVLENFVFAPHFYFCPMLRLYASHFYINGGAMFFTTMSSLSDILFYGGLGFTFGNWQMGPGIGNVDLGLEISPTLGIIESEDQGAAALGSVFATIFNIFKIKAGFSWYLPI